MNSDDLINIRVAVFRGGDSNEYDLSRSTGSNIIRNLSDNYIVEDVSVLKNGEWNLEGKSVNPENFLIDIDLAINSLHGGTGEDGTIQKIFENNSILYTGSKRIPSAVSLKKHLAKRVFENFKIKTPYYEVIFLNSDLDNLASKLFSNFPLPMILKPISSGSSEDICVARDLKSLSESIKNLSKKYESVLIEEYIKGTPVSCCVIDDFRGEDFYSLMPIEMKLMNEDEYFNYSKRESVRYLCPSTLSNKEKNEIQDISKKAHSVLNLRHYSKSDFIVSPKRGVYLLEVNALPDLSERSPFVKSLNESGISFRDFLDHIIKLSLRK